MTKKDYILIARIMNEVYNTFRIKDGEDMSDEKSYKIFVIFQLLEKIRDEFPKDNPKFDFFKFKKSVYK